MGVCGSGKTTIAELIAQQLECLPVLEADDFHTPENKQKMQAGVPLTDVDRWPWLDRLKAAMIAAGEQTTVVTCSALRRTYREHLCAGELGGRVLFIFLDAPEEIIAARLAKRQHAYMNPSLLESQFNTLERPSDDEPVATISVSGPVEESVRAVKDLLEERQ
jgi:gluconokinase